MAKNKTLKVTLEANTKDVKNKKLQLKKNLLHFDEKFTNWIESTKKPEEIAAWKKVFDRELKLDSNVNFKERQQGIKKLKTMAASVYKKALANSYLLQEKPEVSDATMLLWFESLKLPFQVKQKIQLKCNLEMQYAPITQWYSLQDVNFDTDLRNIMLLDYSYYDFLEKDQKLEQFWFWAEEYFSYLKKKKQWSKNRGKNVYYRGLFTRRKLETKSFKFRKEEEAPQVQDVILWIRKNSKLLSYFLWWQTSYIAELIDFFRRTSSPLVNKNLIQSFTKEHQRLSQHIIELKKNFKKWKIADFRAMEFPCRLPSFFRLQPIIEDLLVDKNYEDKIYIKSKWNNLQYLAILEREWTRAAYLFEKMLHARSMHLQGLAKSLLFILTYKKSDESQQFLSTMYYEKELNILVENLQRLKSLLLFSNSSMRLTIAIRACNKIVKLSSENILKYYAKKKKESYRKTEVIHASTFALISLTNLKTEVEETVFLLLKDKPDPYKYKLCKYLKKQEIEEILTDLIRFYSQWIFIDEEIPVLERLMWRNKIIVEILLPGEKNLLALPENIEFTEFNYVDLYKDALPLSKFPIKVYYKEQLKLLRHFPEITKWIAEDDLNEFCQLWEASIDLLILLYFMYAHKRLRKSEKRNPKVETPWSFN